MVLAAGLTGVTTPVGLDSRADADGTPGPRLAVAGQELPINAETLSLAGRVPPAFSEASVVSHTRRPLPTFRLRHANTRLSGRGWIAFRYRQDTRRAARMCLRAARRVRSNVVRHTSERRVTVRTPTRGDRQAFAR